MKKCLFVSSIFVLTVALLTGLSAAPAMAAEKAKYGGILKFNHSKPAGIIGNPLKIRGWNHEFIDFILQTLIRPSNTKLGSFEPQLAESWELAPDKSYYTFKLRKDVKFHDGTVFNAQAAKWNLDMWVKSKRPRLDKVTSVDVVDDYTIRCNLSGWDNVTLFDFAKDTFMVSPTAWKKNGEEWARYNPVGTGAFKLVEFKRKVSLKYEKFKDYWKKGLPYLDGVFITQIPDPMTAIASLKKGEIDAWMGVDPVSGSELRKTGDWVISTNPGPHQVLLYNSTDPKSPWADKRMREALEYAIDKETIAKTTGRGFTFPVWEMIHSIPAKAGTVPRKYNPEKARQLIKEAGHTNLKVKLTYMARIMQDQAVAIQGNLADVGIKIDPNPVTGAVYHRAAFEPIPGIDMVIGNQRGGPNELLVSVDETLASGSVFFQGMKRPKGFDDLLHKAIQQTNMGEALKILYKMEKLAYDDAMFTPLWGWLFITVNAPYVKDAVWFWASMPYPSLETAWLDK
ncbi:MAG: ABC transporter substrate-binding protein [Deltaproteobacteria bacterium]|nr:ABC transporter substrate-binding protein [Deltaproteobacteria bacterium]